MTIYEKLATARVRFQQGKPRMSGKNQFAGYSYFELSDILPVINGIGKELGFVCIVSFTATEATLTVKDVDGSAEVVFTSPMSTASLKGCHDVQNLGAVQTYLKRYLYQNAFEIVESDALNATHNPDTKPETKTEKKSDYDPQKMEALAAIMKKTRSDGSAYFTETQKAGYKKKIAVYGLDETIKQAEIALEEMEAAE